MLNFFHSMSCNGFGIQINKYNYAGKITFSDSANTSHFHKHTLKLIYCPVSDENIALTSVHLMQISTKLVL